LSDNNKTQAPLCTEDLNSDLVADYLRENPMFFLRRDDLLADMTLPHASGNAVSLVEKQVNVLRERNMDMRHRLTNLLEHARDNDLLFEKTKRLTLAIMEARNIDQLVNTTEDSLKNDFNVDFCSLTLFGNPEHRRSVKARIVPPQDARSHIGAIMENSKAVCGVLREQELSFLFPGLANQVGSAAVNPLIYGYPLGILAIGSKDPNYYRSSMGTLFLNYVSDVLNRQIPRLQSEPSGF
jgi:hypothetical protein